MRRVVKEVSKLDIDAKLTRENYQLERHQVRQSGLVFSLHTRFFQTVRPTPVFLTIGCKFFCEEDEQSGAKYPIAYCFLNVVQADYTGNLSRELAKIRCHTEADAILEGIEVEGMAERIGVKRVREAKIFSIQDVIKRLEEYKIFIPAEVFKVLGIYMAKCNPALGKLSGTIEDVSEAAYERFGEQVENYYAQIRELVSGNSFIDPLGLGRRLYEAISFEKADCLDLRGQYYQLQRLVPGIVFYSDVLCYQNDPAQKIHLVIGYNKTEDKYFIEAYKEKYRLHLNNANVDRQKKISFFAEALFAKYPIYLYPILARFKIFVPIVLFEILEGGTFSPSMKVDYSGEFRDISEMALKQYGDNFSSYYNGFEALAIDMDYEDPLESDEAVLFIPSEEARILKSKFDYLDLERRFPRVSGIIFNLTTTSFFRKPPFRVNVTIGYDKPDDDLFMYIEPENSFSSASDYASAQSQDACIYNSMVDDRGMYPHVLWYLRMLEKYKIFVPIQIFEVLSNSKICNPDSASNYRILVNDIARAAGEKMGDDFEVYYQQVHNLFQGKPYKDPLDPNFLFLKKQAPLRQNTRNRLLLGEYDFSFATAFCKKHNRPHKMVATEFMSEQEILDSGAAAGFSQNTASLKTQGVDVRLEIDARKLKAHFGDAVFPYIHFNAPHDKKNDRGRTLPPIISEFFQNAADLQHIGHKIYMALAYPPNECLTRCVLYFIADEKKISTVKKDGAVLLWKKDDLFYVHFNAGKIFKRGKAGSLSFKTNGWEESLPTKYGNQKKTPAIDNLLSTIIQAGIKSGLIIKPNDWFVGYVYKVYDAAAAAGYKLYRKRRFDGNRYPGYEHRIIGSTKSAQAAASMREFVFLKIDPEKNFPQLIHYKSPSEEKTFHEGEDGNDKGYVLPAIDTDNDSSEEEDILSREYELEDEDYFQGLEQYVPVLTELAIEMAYRHPDLPSTYAQFNTLGKGDCLFIAVALQCLLQEVMKPVEIDDELKKCYPPSFAIVYRRLFGEEKRVVRIRGINSLIDPAQHETISQVYSLLCQYDGDRETLREEMKNGILEPLFCSILRSRVVNYMRIHADAFSERVEDNNFGSYLERMEKLGTYGGQPEIEAMSCLLQRPIRVYQFGKTGYLNIERQDLMGCEEEKQGGMEVILKDPICLVHVPAKEIEEEIHNNHYHFVMDERALPLSMALWYEARKKELSERLSSYRSNQTKNSPADAAAAEASAEQAKSKKEESSFKNALQTLLQEGYRFTLVKPSKWTLGIDFGLPPGIAGSKDVQSELLHLIVLLERELNCPGTFKARDYKIGTHFVEGSLVFDTTTELDQCFILLQQAGCTLPSEVSKGGFFSALQIAGPVIEKREESLHCAMQ